MAQINARYRIVRSLSEHPQGTVYLAEDTLAGNAPIALKTLRHTGRDDAHIRALREEFFTLSRFTHPNIARVYDFDIIRSTDLPGCEGNIFFTLEYIEGKDLYHFTQDASEDCLSELIFQIAHALAYIHRHGLIHFDIKPVNIIVTEAAWNDEPIPLVKIIDFGFAVSPIESVELPIRGTLEYIAPELLRGDPFDERVDLYSLGVSLFEVMMRRTPFNGEDATSIIKQHLSSVPSSTADARPDLPAHLHQLIAQLLEKDPLQRVSSAGAIVGQMHGAFPREPLFDTVLSHVPLHTVVGREQDTASVLSMLHCGLSDTCVDDQSCALFVTGETGIGKSTLLQEVIRRAQADGMLVFGTQSFARNSMPYEPLLKILRAQTAYMRSFGPRGEEFLARHADFLSATAPETGPNGSGASGPLLADDPEKRLHFVDTWTTFLFELAAFSPFAMLIDDVDLSDEPTIELLQYVLRSAQGHRLMLVATAAVDSPFIRRLTASPGRKPGIMPLAALDTSAVRVLLHESMNIETASDALAGMILQHLGGSPYIVREFLSQYADTPHADVISAIERDLNAPSGTFEATINRLYEQKLQYRKPEELFLIRILSCFESPVPLSLLQALSPFSSWRLRNFLSLLVTLGIVQSIDEGKRFFLSQSQFRGHVYQGLGQTQAMLHALIADTMENEGIATGRHAEAVARHFKRAGDFRKAYTYLLEAAEHQRAHDALHESIALLNEACSLIPSEEIDLSVFEHLAHAYSQAGDYKTAILLYEQLAMDATDNAKRYTYAKELGLIYTREGRLEEAVGCLTEASRYANGIDEVIDVEDELTIIDISRGRYVEAFDRAMRVLDANTGARNSVVITGILNNLGIIHFYQNRFGDAIACFMESIAILQAHGEKSKLIGPFLNLGNVHSAQEHFEEAAGHWQHALRLAQDVGNLQQEARAYNNIGIAAFHQGHNEEASHHYERAYEIFSRLGFIPGMALCLTNIGEVHLANADYEQAIECWERDYDLYASLQDEHGMTEITLQLAGVRLVFGDTASAQQLLSRAEPLLGPNPINTQLALYQYMKGCLDLACDAHHNADTHLRQARQMFHDANDHRSYCLVSLKLAECEAAVTHLEAAEQILEEVRSVSIEHGYALIEGEALYLLGTFADVGTRIDQKPAILHYLSAFDVIGRQNVTEITWQICHKLGLEYFKRGLRIKCRLYLTYARQSLEYLGSRIGSEALRQSYFTACGRGEVLREIASMIDSMDDAV